MRDILLALSVGAMFLYGYYLMKKVDDFLDEVRRYNDHNEQENDRDTIDKCHDDML